MVAAMHIQNENDRTAFGLRMNELRNVAIGFAVAIALIMVAGQITDSGSASGSVLEDTTEKRFVPPFAVTTPTTSATEDVAYSSTVTWNDPDTSGEVTLSCTSCLAWMTFTDNSDSTATITGTPLDAHVDAGGTAITIQGVSGGDTVQASYTITVTEVNDEPTLTATGATGTFTEGGSNFALFSSAAATDSDSQVVQTYEQIVITITNVEDAEEYIVIDGSDCDITAAATCVADTATNSGAAVVTMDSTTATLTWTGDGEGISEAAMETLINALAYKNTDDSPSVSNNRVVTITTLKDDGGTANSGDDSVTVSIAATVTVANQNDAPVIADSDDTGSVTEASEGTTDTASDTMTVTDADGDSVTWSCTSCTDAGDTQTLTGTYGSWEITESSGAWTYTLSNSDAQTDALDGGDQVTETLTMVASDGTTTASHDVVVTVNGDDDAPTSSTPSTQSGTEDNTFTGYTVSDFPFTDVDGDDTALISITITVVESSGDLEKSTDGSNWADVAADDVILNANIQYLRLAPAADAVVDITFTFKVNDGTQSSSAYVMTTSFANENDAPTVANAQANQAVNEDAALGGSGYQIPANTFTDADAADSCTYTSTQVDGSDLPSWLTFTASTRTYSGTPLNANVGTLNVRSTCSDGNGGSVNDDFNIVVSNTNDVPTSTSFTVTTAEDTEHVFTAAEFGYADVDAGDALVSATLQAATAGTLWVDDDENGAVNGDEAAVANNDVVTAADLAKLSWDPAADANGASYATFTYTLNDGDGNSLYLIHI